MTGRTALSDPSIIKLQDSYQEVPYLSQAYLQSHPDRLCVLGRIFGMSPAPVDRCRVLELGCAGGGNIIPMAYFLPESEFAGIELAKGQVKTAQRTIRDLGLNNIRIEQGNILDVDETWGEFDYIICHGVFSWVPELVQEKILSIASRNLAPQGIAYISYNTYPGWHMREMIRHIMLYHAGQFQGPGQRLGQAKAVVDFLASAVAKNSHDPYALLLKNELECLKSSGDWYIFHDYMEVVNSPIYFHQFIERAEKHRLQYLAEASFYMMFKGEFSDEINNTLEKVSRDIVQKEQYMDFLRNRLFRQTLLCHKDVSLRRMLDEKSVAGLLISSQTRPEREKVDLSFGKTEKFQTRDGMFIETDNPVVKAALVILHRIWPEAVYFEDLLEESLAEMKNIMGGDLPDRKDWRSEMGKGLLHCYVSDAVELRTWRFGVETRISTHPEVSKLTRYLYDHQQCIVNWRHEAVNLDPMAMHLIPVLDGTRNKAELIEHLEKLVRNRTLTLTRYDMPLTDPSLVSRSITESIDNILSGMANAGLFVS